MRLALVLCAVLLASCDDELYYADGSAWEPVEERDVALTENDALRVNPYLRRMPQNDREWMRFIQHLNAQRVRNIGDNVQTFTPTWAGFSADPSGDLSYMDLGAIVVMWSDGELTGTSDDVSMQFSGLPETIRPTVSGIGVLVPCYVINNGVTVAGAVAVDPSGGVTAFINQAYNDGVTDMTGPAPGVFRSVGDKGLPDGWLIVYDK